MSNKEEVVSMIQAVGGKKDGIETIVQTIEQFFENLNLEIEDWKISMEESREGTRVFVRFQVLVKKGDSLEP